ncbi:ANTAR domain-containing protein [Streptomyces fradiae]|uniref:ANTAR domain-containing response regulator n=1 Tax=Streptomyces fradiae TaxID=1906 RepID=UPI0020184FC0|nr:GAF and ANTAR domain-containing protein [Streptomyces fradiae]UQS29759.1 ANTAR domain-containing protein [Streptomyces fradiae]
MLIAPDHEGPGPAPAARRLQRLAEQCVRFLPACCGAAVTLGGGEAERDERRTAATHPDLAALVGVQLATGDGPITAALDSGGPVVAGDLLHDARWPAFRAAALGAGVRATATLPFHRAGASLALHLYGFRPGSLTGAAHGPAAALGAEAAAGLARDRRHRAALAEVGQLESALRSRPVIDQAAGIVMHVLDCGADEAYAALRRSSQLTNRKLADVAAGIVRARGRDLREELARPAGGAGAAPGPPNGEPPQMFV